jgi:hypothetical protein
LEKYSIEADSRLIKNLVSEETGKPKFERYTEPGGKDYTELVFSLKTGGKDIGIPITTAAEGKQLIPFKSAAHMNVRNEIAHVRFKTRDLNGKKVLSVEEMQSDFAIAAKRKTVYGEGVTDFPFKQNWYELVTKRLIRYAADNGFDAIAIPKGSVAATRYGKQGGLAHKVTIQDTGTNVQVKFLDKNGLTVSEIRFLKDEGMLQPDKSRVLVSMEKFKKVVGEKAGNEYLEKLAANEALGETASYLPTEIHKFEKPIFAGEGKGKHQLYDLAIPSFMKKYGKKWNAKVYDDNVPIFEFPDDPKAIRSMPVTILEITPAMKKAVQEGSQSLFEILGFATAAGAGAKAVSDSQGNNTISQQTKNQ